MKFTIYTLGCKVNQYESQAVSELFQKNGFALVGEKETPDIVFINSCSVTAESDRKTRQAVRRYRAKYPNAGIVLMGCMTSAHPETADELPEADIVIGNKNHEALLLKVNEFLTERKRLVEIEKHERNECYHTPAITDFFEHTRAFMKIEDGCDRYCTYCIIPYARGFVRSRDLESIKDEAQALAQNGYKEIVLVGINLSSYGKDNGLNLYDAVKAVAEVEGIARVRLGSLEPDLMTDGLLHNLSGVDKFCPHFHLSLQSGCDETLKRMNRRYDSAFYYDLVSRIRAIFKDAAITTDIMVGFAGETEEEFAKSLAFAKKVGFASAHIFAYSRRKGTVADKLSGQVENAEKQRRSQKMIALTKQSEAEFLSKFVGTTVEVLAETVEEDTVSGYTPNYLAVSFKGDGTLCGKLVSVKIISAEDNRLVGEITNVRS